VDVRELVSGMEELLKHALGFGIELDCRFPRALPPAHVSANRLELALLNAALNAPDAMAGGGRVTISASQATLDGNAGDSTPPPGDYVCIRVVGTRAGMDETARVKATASLPTHGAGGGTDLRHLVTCGISTRSGGRLEMTNRANFDAPIELWLPRAHAGTSPSTRSHCHGNFPGNFPGGCGRTFEGPQ
jgi:hypothetical protein